MESTLKNINSKTYGIVTDPTYISYSLIGFTTLILGYYVFYDKNSAGISSEDVASESSPKSDDANTTSSEAPSALGGMFGTSENKDESTTSSEDTNASSALGGLFGSETKDAAEPAPSVFGTSEEPKEETTVGGKRKKTRRQRKQLRKQNKSKTNKSKK